MTQELKNTITAISETRKEIAKIEKALSGCRDNKSYNFLQECMYDEMYNLKALANKLSELAQIELETL